MIWPTSAVLLVVAAAGLRTRFGVTLLNKSRMALSPIDLRVGGRISAHQQDYADVTMSLIASKSVTSPPTWRRV